MRKKVLIILLVMAFSCACFSCNSSKKNNVENNYTRTINVFARGENFQKVSSGDIMYNGAAVAKISADGYASFDFTSPDSFNMALLTTNKPDCDFKVIETYENSVQLYTIIQIPSALSLDPETDFVDIGGKVVLHSNGETRVKNAQIFIDGNLVLTCESGDYTIKAVVVGSVISATLSGYNFVDVAGNAKSSYTILDAKNEVYSFRCVLAN